MTPVYAGNGDVKYKATRDIAIDAESGKARKPNAIEIAKIVEDLRALTSQPTTDTQIELKNGGHAASLGGGFGGVMLARPSADGTFETLCVFTFEDGVEFLGLVVDDSAQ
jgi:hypothetical protein